MCATDLASGVAYLVTGVVGRAHGTQFLICEHCYRAGAPDPVAGLSRPDTARRRGSACWFGVVGRGPLLPPQPCVSCGLVVVRRAEKLLDGVTCSRACRTSLTRKRNGGRGSGRPCGACDRLVTSGRADFAYCDARCRQKAYRRRVADPAAELLAAFAPFVVASAPGISQALYKALYRLHVAHLRGHDVDGPLARLVAMDPERVKAPDTGDGRRLRDALRRIHPDKNSHAHP